MKSSASIARRSALLAALISLAVLSACSEATTAPSRLGPGSTRTSHDDECHSGWVVVDGVLTCPGG